MNRIISKSILGILGLFVLFSSCKKPKEVLVHQDKDEFTFEEQQKIGNNLADQINLHSTNASILDRASNEAFYAYVDRILESIINTNLVETRNVFDWEIIILNDDNTRSAFTIPGGKIYIYTGLLKMINGEHELFSILAHEVCYSDKGGIIETMKENYEAFLISDIEIGTYSTGTDNIAKTINNLLYSEKNVAKADSFAMEMVCPFQYEAKGLRSFIDRAGETTDQVKWLENRPRSPSTLMFLENRATECGIEELTFTERYESFKVLLP